MRAYNTRTHARATLAYGGGGGGDGDGLGNKTTLAAEADDERPERYNKTYFGGRGERTRRQPVLVPPAAHSVTEYQPTVVVVVVRVSLCVCTRRRACVLFLFRAPCAAFFYFVNFFFPLSIIVFVGVVRDII